MALWSSLQDITGHRSPNTSHLQLWCCHGTFVFSLVLPQAALSMSTCVHMYRTWRMHGGWQCMNTQVCCTSECRGLSEWKANGTNVSNVWLMACQSWPVIVLLTINSISLGVWLTYMSLPLVLGANSRIQILWSTSIEILIRIQFSQAWTDCL